MDKRVGTLKDDSPPRFRELHCGCLNFLAHVLLAHVHQATDTAHNAGHTTDAEEVEKSFRTPAGSSCSVLSR